MYQGVPKIFAPTALIGLALILAGCAGEGFTGLEAPMAEEIGVAEQEVFGLGQGECFAIEDGACVGVTRGARMPVPAEGSVGATEEGIGIFR